MRKILSALLIIAMTFAMAAVMPIMASADPGPGPGPGPSPRPFIPNDNDYQKLVTFALQDDNLTKLGWDLDEPRNWEGINWISNGEDPWRVGQIHLADYGLSGELDVSNYTELEYLFVGANQLTGLDVSGNTKLITLYANVNQLTELDFSDNIALKSLLVSNNQLTSISSLEGLENLGRLVDELAPRVIDVRNNFLDLDDPAIMDSINKIKDTVEGNGGNFYYSPQSHACADRCLCPICVCACFNKTCHDCKDCDDCRRGWSFFDILSAFIDGNESYISRAGEPNVELVDGKLFISNRVNPWDAMDVNLGWLDPGDYTITVTMDADGEQNFRITCHTNPWLDAKDATGGATLSVDFTVNAVGTVSTKTINGAGHRISPDTYGPARMRIDIESRENYYITSIVITKREPEIIDDAVFEEALQDDNPYITLTEDTGSVITEHALDLIKDSEKVVEIELESGLVITIDPETITDNAQAIDLNIDIEITSTGNQIEGIPANSIVISPAASGEFGFEIGFTISASELQEAGLRGNSARLWHIKDGVVTEEGKITRNQDGSVTIGISRASYYVLSRNHPIDGSVPTGLGNYTHFIIITLTLTTISTALYLYSRRKRT